MINRILRWIREEWNRLPNLERSAKNPPPRIDPKCHRVIFNRTTRIYTIDGRDFTQTYVEEEMPNGWIAMQIAREVS